MLAIIYGPSGEKCRISPAIHIHPFIPTPNKAPVPLPNHPMRWDWPWVHPFLGAHWHPTAGDRLWRTDSGCSVVVKVWAQLVRCLLRWLVLVEDMAGWSTPSVYKIPTQRILSCPPRRDHFSRKFHLPTIEIQVTCDIFVFGGVCAGKATRDPVLETFYSKFK